MTHKSEFINEISSRGFIYQGSDIENLDKIMSKDSLIGYIGFDITSDSLHVGSLVQLMLLYWMQEYGHKPLNKRLAFLRKIFYLYNLKYLHNILHHCFHI